MKLIKLFLIALKETLAIFIPCLRKPIDYSAVEKKVLEFKSGDKKVMGIDCGTGDSKIFVFHASPYGDYPDMNYVILDEAEDDEIV